MPRPATNRLRTEPWGEARPDGRIVVVRLSDAESESLVAQLGASTFEVTSVAFRRSMLNDVSAVDPDVVILDHDDSAAVDLIRVCADLARTTTARIIVVSTEHEPNDDLQIDALDAGADDFVSATTSPGVLLARVRAAMRGRPAAERRRARIHVGDVMVDLDAHEVFVAGALTKCPPLQFVLLVTLARVPNRVIERETLLSGVWGALPSGPDSTKLRTAISVLRGVLGTGALRPRIETVPHVGYRLVIDESAGDAA